MSPCPACLAINPADSRFCNQCGARLLEASAATVPSAASYAPRHLVERVLRDRAALMGERKRVTVLFADIKGSTHLAAQAGAEAWHVILDRFFAVLTRAVHRYEGTVNQYTGDGIMALFGAPLAHEDDAIRAALAALDMQAEVRRFADELRLERGLNLSMRVGLNTGEVIVGRIGDDLRMDYTAQGLTTNLAARMEQICEPGRVLLTRATAALIEGYCELRSLGEMVVTGLDRPLEVFELLGRGRHASRLERTLARGGSSFIGRSAEMQNLAEALARVREGRGGVIAITGEAGIGKSRLCHEFAALCADSGVPVHRAAGLSYAQGTSMLPVQTWLRARLGLDARAAAPEIRRKVSEAFAREGQPPKPGAVAFVFDFLGAGEPGELSPDLALTLREPMAAGLAHYLPCADQPQVLLLEDLHFADAQTLEFLPLLAAQVRAHGTLLLLNYRSEFDDTGLRASLDTKIELPALESSQVERLACEWLGEDPSLGAVHGEIRARAGGNPFFVEEAVAALVEGGYLGGRRGDYRQLRPLHDWPIADTVHALIAARIDRLPSAYKSVLHAAAVIGPEFDSRLLESVAEGTDSVADALRRLEDAGFIEPCDGEADRYRFCQPLMQEIAYGTQLQTSRAEAHGRLATALEARPGCENSAAASEVAHHWAAAGQWQRAGTWNLHSARWISLRDLRSVVEQFRLGIQHFERAAGSDNGSSMANPVLRRQRIAARAGLIRVAQLSNVEPAAIDQAYAEAQALAAEAKDAESNAELLISYGNELLRRGEAEAAARHTREAVDLCLVHKLPAMVNRFRLPILLSHSAVGRPQEGVDLVNAAGGAGWLTGPIDEENFMSRGFNALRLAWNGELARAARDMDAAAAFADRVGRGISWLHASRVDLAWFEGRPADRMAEVITYSRRALEQAEVLNSPYFRAIALRAVGTALCMDRRFDEALLPLREGRPLVASGAGAHQFEANYLAVMAEALIGAGRIAEAADTAMTAIESGRRSGSRLWELRASIAGLQLPPEGLGLEPARELMERVQSLIDFTGALVFLPWLAELRARRTPDPEGARRLRAEAAASFERCGAKAHADRLRSLDPVLA